MTINKTSIAALLVFGFISVLIAVPVQAALCDKKPDHPNCTGNGGGGGDPTVELRLRDAASDRILSDANANPPTGSMTYSDGEADVSARIREDDGLLLFNINADRSLEIDFGDQSRAPDCEQNNSCRGNFAVVSTGDYSSGAAGTISVLAGAGSEHLNGQFLGMAIFQTLPGELKIGFGGGGKSDRFSVRFAFPFFDAELDPIVAENSSRVTITRNSQTVWFVEGLAGDEAILFSIFKNKGQNTQDEGSYHMPFGITVACDSCPPPP